MTHLLLKAKKLFFKLPNHIIYIIYCLYDYFAFSELREKKKSYGNMNENLVFYVIRPIKNTKEGLMSLLLNVEKYIVYAEKKGYIPVVDFKNYETQYYKKNYNAWELFFDNLNKYSLDEVYKSKNVILSDLKPYRSNLFNTKNRFSEDNINKARELTKKYIKINEKIYDRYLKELNDCVNSNTLGLYLRGTDYTNLKPVGHCVQPSVEQAKKVVDEYISKYACDNIFLVTEDYDIYIKIKETYGDLVKTASFDTFIKKYDKQKYLSESDCINELSHSSEIRGINYLIKILLLSQCKNIIAGNTCGSWAAAAFSEYKTNIFVFDLGNY